MRIRLPLLQKKIRRIQLILLQKKIRRSKKILLRTKSPDMKRKLRKHCKRRILMIGKKNIPERQKNIWLSNFTPMT